MSAFRTSIMYSGAGAFKRSDDSVRTSAIALSLGVAGNLISSLVLVLGNRRLLAFYGVSVVTLTFIQFVILSVVLRICQSLNLFNRRSFVFKDLFILSVTKCIFILTLNSFLSISALATYQVVKATILPLLFILNATFFNRHKLKVFKRLVPPIIVLAGATYVVITDDNFSSKLVCSSAFLCLLFWIYHYITAQKQAQIGASHMQLSLFTFPLSSAYLLPVAIFERFIWESQSQHSLVPELWCVLLGLAASLECLTGHFLEGKLGDVQNVVYGQLKFCLIIFLGMKLFQELDIFKAIAVVLVISGTTTYDLLKVHENKISSVV